MVRFFSRTEKMSACLSARLTFATFVRSADSTVSRLRGIGLVAGKPSCPEKKALREASFPSANIFSAKGERGLFSSAEISGTIVAQKSNKTENGLMSWRIMNGALSVKNLSPEGSLVTIIEQGELLRAIMLTQVEINFGRGIRDDREALEDVAEIYLGALRHAGQLCGDNIRTWIGSEFIVTAMMAGLGAQRKASHSNWGLKHLEAVKEKFGREPVWTIRDDEKARQNITWKGAGELVLFTHAFDDDSPVCRTDIDGQVPVFLLPVSEEVKNDLVRWQDLYVLHDRMWLASGTLEMAAYRELTLLDSELTEDGRQLCRELEKATRVPTYYFLMRYYSHPTEEFSRRCPGCGGKWRTKAPEEKRHRDWHFLCKRCRLVSNAGVEVNRRLARIGF